MYRKGRGVVRVTFIVLPLLIALTVALVGQFNITDVKPEFGDELWWWQQANAVSEYGMPLGYWGYNGGAAKVGTFATWGPAMVVPYGIFASILGWGYSSYLYANIFYWILANIIFVCLTKPKTKELFFLTVCNLFMITGNCYLFTAMAECVRYALGITAVALIYFLYRHPKCNWGIKYIFIPLFLIYITQEYLLFGIFFLFYMICILREFSIYKNLILSGTSFLIFVFAARKFLRLFSSPYPVVDRRGELGGIIDNFTALKNIFLNQWNFRAYFLCSYFILLFVIVFYLLWKRRSQKEELDKRTYIAALLVLLAFLGGHMILYNIGEIRGLIVGLIIASYILCLSKSKKTQAVFIVCMVIQLLGCKTWCPNFFEDRFQTSEWKAAVLEMEELLDNIVIVDNKTDNPWDNTIATYNTGGLELTPALPKGIAVNSMMNGDTNIDAKYAVIGKEADIIFAEEKIESLEENGFSLKRENEKAAILVKEHSK